MKKKLLLSVAAFILCVYSATSVMAATSATASIGGTVTDSTTQVATPSGDGGFGPPPPWCKAKDMKKMKQCHDKRKAEFEKRLKLTPEQKKLHDQNKMAARKEIKPIYDEIKAKRAKIMEICACNLPQAEKDKQTCCLKEEIRALKTKADLIRQNNMKAFEASLSSAQKKELEKMKNERKNEMEKFHKKHKVCGCKGTCPSGPPPEGVCPSHGPCPLK